MAEKVHILRISEKELKNPVIRKCLLTLVEMRVRLQKHNKYITISKVEFAFLRHHRTWRNVEDYAPDKKDRFKGEQGKYNSKRCVVRGMK